MDGLLQEWFKGWETICFWRGRAIINPLPGPESWFTSQVNDPRDYEYAVSDDEVKPDVIV